MLGAGRAGDVFRTEFALQGRFRRALNQWFSEALSTRPCSYVDQSEDLSWGLIAVIATY
jgi:hypothetical protein